MSKGAGQKSIFILLLLLSATASIAGYRLLQGKYIVYHEAEKLFLAGDFKGSIPLLVKALDMGLNLPAAYRHLGDAFLATKDFKSAVKPYQIYTGYRQDDYQTLVKLALVHDLLGQEQLALDLLKRAIAQNHDQSDLWLALAEVHKTRHEYGPAQKAYEHALDLKPGLPQAVFGLAETYAWQKRYNEALRLYRAYLAEHPRNRTARINMARVLSWQGDFNEAIRQYDLALEGEK